MKRIFNHLTMTLATAAALTACQPQSNGIRLEHQGDTLTICLLYTSDAADD